MKKENSTTPNIDTKKLREGSPELAAYYDHIDEGPIPDKLINVDRDDFDTIALQFLAQQAKIEGLEEKVRKLESIPVKVREISDLEFEPIDDEAARQGDPDER